MTVRDLTAAVFANRIVGSNPIQCGKIRSLFNQAYQPIVAPRAQPPPVSTGCVMPVMTTSAPNSATRLAVTAPIPRVPPVMSATLPANFSWDVSKLRFINLSFILAVTVHGLDVADPVVPWRPAFGVLSSILPTGIGGSVFVPLEQFHDGSHVQNTQPRADGLAKIFRIAVMMAGAFSSLPRYEPYS